MKKNSLLICALMSLSLFGCGYSRFDMSKLATEEEIAEFFEEKDLDEVKEECNFEIVVEVEDEDKSGSETSKVELEGRIITDSDDETIEMYYEAKATAKTTSYSADGKNTTKSTVKEEFTCLMDDDEFVFYINQSNDSSSDYHSYKSERKIKTYDADEAFFGGYIDDVVEFDYDSIIGGDIGFSGLRCYIDGDDIAMVSSTDKQHVVMIYNFDGDSLESLEYTIETATSTMEMVMSFDDVKSISRPSDASDYEDLTIQENEF